MILTVRRRYLRDTYTIGDLYVDGIFLCNVLEDRVRDLTQEPKVYGNTAIPAGSYRVVLSFSHRFQRVLPEILNVPYFQGIRIHAGNGPDDTEGCLLVGKNDIPGKVTRSRFFLAELLSRMEAVKTIELMIT